MTPIFSDFYLLTGATGAIGKEIARALAAEGKCLILACRNVKKGEELQKALVEEFKISRADAWVLQLDLAEEESVREAIDHLERAHIGNLAAVINNAGIMNRSYLTDSQGRELTMAVNYHNTRLFNELLLSHIGVNHGGAIVFTTSLTRFMGRRYGYTTEITEHNFSQLGTYGVSKKAITDYAAELSKRLPRVRVNCADPGIVDTGMISMHRWYDPIADVCFRPFIRSPRQGAEPTLRALHTDLTGKIFCRRKIRNIR